MNAAKVVKTFGVAFLLFFALQQVAAQNTEWGDGNSAEIAKKFASDIGITPNPAFDDIVAKARTKLGDFGYQWTVKHFNLLFSGKNEKGELLLKTNQQKQCLFYMSMELLVGDFPDPSVEDLDVSIESFGVKGMDYFDLVYNKIYPAILNRINEGQMMQVSLTKREGTIVEHTKLLSESYQKTKLKGDDQAKQEYIEMLENSIQVYKDNNIDIPVEVLNIQEEIKKAGRYNLLH